MEIKDNFQDYENIPEEAIFVGNPNEFLAKSITSALTDRGCKIHNISYNVNALHKLLEETKAMDMILIVESADLIKGFLTYLRDIMTDKGMGACLIGEAVELNEVESYMSGCRLKKVPRPADLQTVIKEIKTLHQGSIRQRSKKEILIIDDDPVFLQHMRGLLQNAYKVYVANSGASGIMVLTKHHVDLILLDYEMPVTKGPQILQMLREEDSLKDIPVMFLSGKKDAGSVKQAVALRPENYLTKDLTADEIFSVIGAFFEKTAMPSLYNTAIRK